MATAVRFWDRHAAGYARRPVADEASYRRKLEETRGYLAPEMSVLEVGCGTGTTALHHAPHVRCVRAIDASGRMIEIARAKAADQGVANVAFEQLTLEALDPDDGPYDMVMAHSLLHLLDDRHAALAKFRRLLKPGGVLVSSTACLAGVNPLLRLILPVGGALGLLPTLGYFSAEQLLQDVASAGFRVDRHWQPAPNKGLFVVAIRS